MKALISKSSLSMASSLMRRRSSPGSITGSLSS
jgi:hypothetical protein